MTSLTAITAEQIVLGCCLQMRDLSDRIDGLRPDHFAVESHRVAFAEICAAWGRGAPLDPVSLDDILRNQVPPVGDLSYWVECAEAGYSTALLPAHVSTVRNKAIRRSLLAAADRIAGFAHEEGDVTEHLASASAAVAKILDGASVKGPRLVGEVIREHLQAIGQRWDGTIEGQTTGFRDLDAKIRLRPGNLVLVAARPAMGKTSLAMQIGAHIAKDGVVVAFSQEMADTELVDRLLASIGRVKLAKIISGGLDHGEQSRFGYASEQAQALKLYIDDQPALRIAEIRAKVMTVRRKHPVALVIVDYLQLMAGDGQNRNAEIEQISRGLKSMAKELQCPVIALSQLSRACEARPNKRPMLSDLRDSGAIEQDADLVLMIYRDEIYNPNSPDAGTAEILIRKNRQGPTGEVRLTWLGEYTSFADCAYQEAREDYTPMRSRRGFDE
ncbi:replicative DNA helicase [Aromatoleum anaerobium]|uniref:Replicative DNA helicase n=1 Tax=Aromatoleum anaerobium TaxID=182180 RepID=A0ABX1PUI9_9RHOO|nr:replicative DNA helicase [Aromatoleum anaerobium]MCK0507940.1 replicative DNA helicase [Aromatoleum anaerobium]